MSVLLEKYRKQTIPELMKHYGFGNIMQVPRIMKVTLNMGVGEGVADKSLLEDSMNDLMLISGQKPLPTKARKSIAGFKIRQGWAIGCKVTLRNQRMWDFLDRLVFIGFARIRDFRGLNPKSFNGNGDFSVGIVEQIIFPEIDYDKIRKLRGLDIAITTNTDSDERGLMLLKSLGFPFRS